MASASKLLQSADEFRHSTFESKPQLEDVAFGISPFASTILLEPVIHAALKSGDRRLNIDTLPGPKLLDRLNTHSIEFFVCAKMAVPQVAHVTMEPLITLPVGCFARVGHPLEHRNDITASDIRGYPWMGSFGNDMGSTNLGPFIYNTAVSCDDLRLLSTVIGQSDALCILPRAFAPPDLVQVHCTDGALPDRLLLVACRLQSTELSSGARATLDDIRLVANAARLRGAPSDQ